MLDASPPAPMEVREYVGILRRRLWVIVTVTVIVVGVSLAWSVTRESTYTARGELVIASDGAAEPDVATQIRIIESQAVHQLALQHAPNAATVTAGQDGTSSGVTLTTTSPDPKVAARTVNAHTDAYVQYIRQRALDRYDAVAADLAPEIAALQAQIDSLDSQILAGVPASTVENQRGALADQIGVLQSQLQELKLNVALAGRNIDIVTRAAVPSEPASPKPRETALIALGAGLLLGVLVAFLIEFADDTIRTRQDLLRVAGDAVPTMGVIPASRSGRTEIVSLTAPHSPAAEAYRSLRTAVQFASFESGRCVEVTSPRSRHGKTETVANLAVLAAQAGQRVVVVDCDMRTPRLHDLFGLPNDIGFTSVVYGEPLSNAFKRVPGLDGLYVLTSGPIPPNPAELLASERCHDVLASLQEDDTLVLVDTPPLLLVTDAAALAPATGGVLLVATARVTRRKQLRQALERLYQIDARLLGTVLYRADSTETGGFGEEEGRRERRRARRTQHPDAAATAQTPEGSPEVDAGSG